MIYFCEKTLAIFLKINKYITFLPKNDNLIKRLMKIYLAFIKRNFIFSQLLKHF